MPRRRAVLVIAVAGTVAVVTYAVVAALQILVLNPRAGAPGLSLEQIHADMAAMNEAPGTVGVLIFLGLGVVLALGLLVLLATRADATPRAAAYAYLLMLALGAPVYFVASFGPGMALADTYFISGGDHTPWGAVLYCVSLAALVGVAVSLIVPRSKTASRSEPLVS